MSRLALSLALVLTAPTAAFAQDDGEPPVDAETPAPDAPAEPAGDEPERDEPPGDDDFLSLDDDDVLPPEEDDGDEADGGDADGELTMNDLVGEEDEDDIAIEVDTVTATAIDEPEATPTGASQYGLGEEELERFRYDDPHAQVLQVPGVYVRQEDGFGLRPNIGMRGVTPDRSRKISLMVDGVLFGPAPYSAPAGYFFPILSRMVGLDAYLGPASLPYGPFTVGGALDWSSREVPRESEGEVDLTLGSYLTGRAALHYGTGNSWGGFLVDAIYLRSDGFRNLDFNAGGQGNTGFDRGEIVARGELRGALGTQAYQRLELRVGLSLEGSNETYLGLTREDFDARPYRSYGTSSLDRMEWWRTQVQLRWTVELGDALQVRTVAYRHDFNRSWFKVNALERVLENGTRAPAAPIRDILLDPTRDDEPFLNGYAVLTGAEATDPSRPRILIGNNGRTFVAQGIQSDAHLRLDGEDISHEARLGIRLHHDRVRRDHTEAPYLLENGVLMVEPGMGLRQTTDNVGESFALSAYFSWATTWGPLTITPTLRAEIIWNSLEDRLRDLRGSAYQDGFLGGFSANYQLLDELAVVAGVSTGFSPGVPSTNADEVRPERSVNYEAGFRFQHEETGTTASVIGFFNDYSNLTFVCSFGSGCANDAIGAQSSTGAANVLGLELAASSAPKVDEVRFPVRVAYTFVFTEFRNAFTDLSNPFLGDVNVGDRIPYIPMHQITAQAGFELDRFGLNLSAGLVSEMWEQAGRGEVETTDVDRDGLEIQTDAYFLLDAAAYVMLFENTRLYVRGENLTMTQAVVTTRPFGARPNRPFGVYVGIRQGF